MENKDHAETDEQKREVVEQLLRLWRRLPDRRFGQLLATSMPAYPNPDIYYEGDYALIARMEALVSDAAQAPEVPELGLHDVFFFGCWSKDRIGHYLYPRHGSSVLGRAEDPCGPLDGTYCVFPSAVREPQNRGRLVHRDHWTVLAFWDRTADQRYGSNAAFLAKGTHDFVVMCEIARRHFPTVWARITASEPMLHAVDD